MELQMAKTCKDTLERSKVLETLEIWPLGQYGPKTRIDKQTDGAKCRIQKQTHKYMESSVTELEYQLKEGKKEATAYITGMIQIYVE